MYTNKQKMLDDAMMVLNNANNPWEVMVEGDCIIASWKWLDARFFGPQTITDEKKEYKFIVTLKDNGKYKETDIMKTKKPQINFRNGKLSFGSSAQQGNLMSKSIRIGLGKDKQTGEYGLIKSTFSTEAVKDPIRRYLKDNGWKKAGLFF